MNLFRGIRLQKPSFGFGAGCGLAALLGVLFLIYDKGMPEASYDRLLRLRDFLGQTAPVPTEVVVVYVDEDSYAELGQSYYQPWDRALHANLVGRLQSAGARTVVFDFVFSERGQTNTATFAEAMRAHGKVVLASHLWSTDSSRPVSGWRVERSVLELESAAGAVGAAEVSVDRDLTVRQLVPLIPLRGFQTNVETLAWVAAALEGAQVTRSPPKPGADWWLNYYGPPGSIKSVSYVNALHDEPPQTFRDKVVFIGERRRLSVQGQTPDIYWSPYRGWPRGFDGVEIHAISYLNLARGEWLRRVPPLAEFVLVLAAGVGLGCGLTRLRPLAATGVAALVAVGLPLLATGLLVQARVLFCWTPILVIQLPVALGWSLALRAARAQAEGESLAQSLALYLSPKLVSRIRHQPELLRPGGTQQRVSILFTDISSFSRISGRMDAEDLFELLNQYYDRAIGCIHETDGTVVNLAGDAIFAIWNAPSEQADHHERACRAALLLHQRIVEFNSRLEVVPLSTRVSLHSGQVCVGNLGSKSHFNYTAIGEPVNLATRLEGLNKFLGTNILATREFLKPLGDRFPTRAVGYYRFKGLDQVVEVHEVIAPSPAQENPGRWQEVFAKGLRAFQRRVFDEAEQAFREVLTLRPGDGPSQFYLARLGEFRGQVLPIDWQGEIELKEK